MMRFLHGFLINLLVCLVCAVIRTQISSASTDKTSFDNSEHVSVDNNLTEKPELNQKCDSFDKTCSELSAECLDCQFNYSCVYGTNQTVTCLVKEELICLGSRSFVKTYICAFCYQLNPLHHNCTTNSSCKLYSQYKATCQVNDHRLLCLGNRSFQKQRNCNFTTGYKWSTALILSITLGGFGVDRFYLGSWHEGIGKLFSFGGLGVWTLTDVLLIATGYLKPADGSVYI